VAILMAFAFAIGKTAENHVMVHSYNKDSMNWDEYAPLMTFNILYASFLAFFGVILLIAILFIGCNIKSKESLPAIIANSLFASLSSLCYVGLAIYDSVLFRTPNYEEFIDIEWQYFATNIVAYCATFCLIAILWYLGRKRNKL